jgi:hypothetical protein
MAVQVFLGRILMIRFFALFVLAPSLLLAEGPRSIAPTKAEEQKGYEHNKRISAERFKPMDNVQTGNPQVLRPFSEVEEAGFLLFHADTGHKSSQIKDTLASNLPNGVKLIVYTQRANQKESLQRHYEALTGQGRVEVLGLSYKASDRAIWARDNTPIPVLLSSQDGQPKWGAVDAVYYGGDEPDRVLAGWFHIPLFKNPYEFEGGNFVADSKGNCVIVNKVPTQQIPDSVFTNTYGCKNVVRLKHVSGIGHADERVKFINERVVLTDTQSYVPQLSALGYEVRLLPTPQKGDYRTYVNSLSVNEKIFVPVFDETNDEEALATTTASAGITIVSQAAASSLILPILMAIGALVRVNFPPSSNTFWATFQAIEFSSSAPKMIPRFPANKL